MTFNRLHAFPRRHAGVLLLLLGLAWSSARADWRFDAETGAVYDSNLSRSDRDSEEDWAWKTELRAANGFQLARDLRLNVGADLDGQMWTTYHALSNLDLGSTAGLRYRFGLGRQAPWLVVEDRLGYAWFNEPFRNGWANQFGVRGGMNITERLSFEAGYLFDHFAAQDDFFDISGQNFSLQLTYAVTSALRIAAGYQYRYGDVISYAIPPRPDILGVADAEREDVATFGAYPLRTAYSLEASTNSVSVSAAYAVNNYFSVRVSYEYAVTTHDPLQYEDHLV